MSDINQQIKNIFAPFKELPFLFIGSGMARRYYNLPTWEDLLRYFAQLALPSNKLAFEAIRESVVSTTDDRTATLPAIASEVENQFNAQFYRDETLQKKLEAYKPLIQAKISPFKIAISTYISQHSKRSTVQKLEDEFALLKLIGKRNIAGVITTNYDCLAEELFNTFTVFIGQESLLFSDTYGVSEIYKIHGCCQKPGSIVINKLDYDNFEAKNAYLAAKLLTIFVEHPIVFLGYSISDSNIESILRAIADCLSMQNLSKLKKRLILVEYMPEPAHIPEINTHSINFGGDKIIEMTKITLHDYMPLYRVLSTNKSLYNPHLLRKLKRNIYQLISTNYNTTSTFKVTDIEDDTELDKIEVVVGVGVGKHAHNDVNRAHFVPSAIDLFNDVIFDNMRFEIKSLVESALPSLLRHHSWSLPTHKYIAQYEHTVGQPPPATILAQSRHRYDDFISDTIKKLVQNATPDIQHLLLLYELQYQKLKNR